MRVYAIGAVLAATLRATPAAAQVVRGTVRAQASESTVPGAQVIATDTLGKVLRDVVSDASGRFTFTVPGNLPFVITVKKVGWQPSMTDHVRAAPGDTIDIDLLVPADPVALSAVEVTAKKDSRNARSYEEAQRRGWKTFSPEMVERHRETSINFTDMMRAVSAPVQLPTRANDCVKSLRNPLRCLVYVVDGTVVGTSMWINPREVYFFSVLSSTESAVQFGDKAPWGAILVVTRMYGDTKKP